MANENAPFGFRQYSGNGSAPTYEQVTALVAYNAAAIYYGDPVIPINTGYIQQGVDSSGSVVQIAGVFVGCKYLSVSQKRTVWSNYWPGSDVSSGNDVEAYIVNDPNAQFEVQTDATGLTKSAINSNIGFVIGTGNANNGLSGASLDTSTLAVTATLPFRVVGLVTFPPGGPGTQSGAYNYAIVAFNSVSTKQLTSVG